MKLLEEIFLVRSFTQLQAEIYLLAVNLFHKILIEVSSFCQGRYSPSKNRDIPTYSTLSYQVHLNNYK